MAITHAPNVRPGRCGERLDNHNEAVAHFTSGQGPLCFGWEDAAEDSPLQLAGNFIERSPEIAGQGKGADPAYARWYAEMIHATEPDGLICIYADWDLPGDTSRW